MLLSFSIIELRAFADPFDDDDDDDDEDEDDDEDVDGEIEPSGMIGGSPSPNITRSLGGGIPNHPPSPSPHTYIIPFDVTAVLHPEPQAICTTLLVLPKNEILLGVKEFSKLPL